MITSLRSLSNFDLHQELLSLSSQERRLTVQVLHHLREAEARMLYAERGHSSLFEYVVQELQYSESSAQRRISAMRALRDLPELEAKIETGELKVTQLSQVQSFLRNEKKEGKSYSVEAKRELILETVGKSARETERILTDRNPSFAVQDKVKMVTSSLTQITFTADEALLEQLGEIKDRFAHQLPSGSTPSDLIKFMAEFVLKRDPMKKEGRHRASESDSPSKEADSEISNSKVQIKNETPEQPEPKCTSAAEVNVGLASKQEVKSAKKLTRYIPAATKRQIWKKYDGRCSHRSKSTGKLCGARHRVQIDHVVPFALGGSSSDPENLRLLCWAHNAERARDTFREAARYRA